MSSPHQIASFRKVSAGVLASAHLAAQDDRPAVLKKDVSLVLKRVAPALGIDGTAYHVLDILLGLVQGDDFKAGRRPVVAISNQRLADYTRKTTRTVTRCLKKLVEAGILAYRDSPTGRRFVYRGRAGEAEQAYGLDFTPACFNLEAFKQQADAFQRRLKAEQEAKRTITRCSRAVVDMVAAFGSEFEIFLTRIKVLHEGVDGDVFERAGRIEQIYLDAVAAQQALNETEMSSAGDIDVSPISITTPTVSLKRNQKRPCSNEQETQFTPDNGYAVEMAL
ncbi:plasmid replication protein RepC, partial [Roseibium polysiphoniae]